MLYGACESPKDANAKRITYVINEVGKIGQVYGKVDAAKHPAELLHTL